MREVWRLKRERKKENAKNKVVINLVEYFNRVHKRPHEKETPGEELR